MTVFFIGAGPGDPELITVKGQRLVRSCPVILYAGSLVPAAVLEGHSAEQMINTAELDLDQIVALLAAAHAKGQHVARVHSGDPSLYGAIGEQIRRLRELGIPYEIVPGVTATAADPHALREQNVDARRRAIGRSRAASRDIGDPPRRAASRAHRR
jgi:precorrin-4/cobalt-precorrin-4 C11-methyltransferase